jgi:ferric-dicitrate binding protein FerR (iron transport regulator)
MRRRLRACERWIALSDREAVGEALSADDQRYLREHASACEACGAEAATFREIEGLVEAPPRDESSRPEGRNPPAVVGLSRGRVARRLGVGVATLAACAAAVFLEWRPPRATPPPTGASLGTVTAPRLTATSGKVGVDARMAQAGESLSVGAVVETAEGDACLSIPSGITACLSPGSRVRVLELGPNRRLEVLRGKLAAELEPQPPGASFAVVTREGTATAIGTAFSVEVPEDGGHVITRVLHGTVLVHTNGGSDSRVVAHSQVVLTRDVTPLPREEEAQELELIEHAPSTTNAQPAVLRVESTPAGAALKVDGRVMGRTPASLLLDPGEHRIEIDEEENEARDVVHLEPGEELKRAFVLPRTSPAGPSASAHASAAPPSPSAPAQYGSPEELLLAARARGAHGDARGAAAAYHELFTSYPRSAEAEVARVAYGELELGALGNPQGALVAFDEYLRTGGPLGEEASYGKIRALRALGRTADEEAAVRAFLERFPRGAAAGILRERKKATQERP